MANYTVGYAAEYVMKTSNSTEEIEKFVSEIAFARLENATLANGTADATYLNTTAKDGLRAESK